MFLAKEAYIDFPIGHRINFGLADRGDISDFNYGKACPPGQVVVRLDSVWGVRNKDRGIMQTCGSVGPVSTLQTAIRHRNYATVKIRR